MDTGSISRGELFELADECSKKDGGWSRLLIAAFAWGTGDTGYGPFRCREIVQGESAVDAVLREAVRLLDSQGPLAAYFYLNNWSEGHVRGLGPAFFTKFLYFAGGSARGQQALILDQVLSGAIRTISGNGGLLRGSSWKTLEYGVYLAYVARLAQCSASPTDEVERRIFQTLAERTQRSVTAKHLP